ncbi:hypothetical protein PVAP13_7KG024948 [Panicum virgatum]|uniref:Uncharacterized protein n=1 Tax=Panicum virgatum TaxID=38727 RepID=A0A8T0QKY8_PANVG|nr:hypothetical protein PVAP13_7KG024948 [Panicum virgatum]
MAFWSHSLKVMQSLITCPMYLRSWKDSRDLPPVHSFLPPREGIWPCDVEKVLVVFASIGALALPAMFLVLLKRLVGS